MQSSHRWGRENLGRRQPVNYYGSLQIDDVQSDAVDLNTDHCTMIIYYGVNRLLWSTYVFL